jgi:hypothetical protein
VISAIDVVPVRNGSADATTTKLIALLMITASAAPAGFMRFLQSWFLRHS